MTHDLDINRAAKAIIRKFGEDAPNHAAMRADAMLEGGDLDGHVVWMVILRVIDELQRTAPKPGEAVH
jgi:hypothetical protein